MQKRLYTVFVRYTASIHSVSYDTIALLVRERNRMRLHGRTVSVHRMGS